MVNCGLFKFWVQIEEIKENHEASLMEMETTHSDTLATLQEEHARTVKSKYLKIRVERFSCFYEICAWRKMILRPFRVSDLKMAHEQQTKSLEEEFEKIRLSLQVKCWVF